MLQCARLCYAPTPHRVHGMQTHKHNSRTGISWQALDLHELSPSDVSCTQETGSGQHFVFLLFDPSTEKAQDRFFRALSTGFQVGTVKSQDTSE